MRERLPRYLVLTGTLLVVTGILVTTVLVVRRDDCNVSPSSVCQGYTTGIHWAYPIIVIGAGFFVAAALAATNLVQRGHDTHGPPTRHDDHAPNAQ